MSRALRIISSVFLAALLMLLTVGLPVTYSSVAQWKKVSAPSDVADKNPYSNSTEEKAPKNSLTLSEEYVHGSDYESSLALFQVSVAYIHAHEATYVAFHGEMLCPPPNYPA